MPLLWAWRLASTAAHSLTLSSHDPIASPSPSFFPPARLVRLWLICLALLPILPLTIIEAVSFSPQSSTSSALPSESLRRTIPSAPGTLLIPLTRLAPKDVVSIFEPRHSSIEKRAQPVANGLTPISTIGRVGYAGHILIGNPPQRLAVLFDTGSDLALVISDRCQGRECPDLTHFSCSTSTTCVDLGGGDGVSGSGELVPLASSGHEAVVNNLAMQNAAVAGHANNRNGVSNGGDRAKTKATRLEKDSGQGSTMQDHGTSDISAAFRDSLRTKALAKILPPQHRRIDRTGADTNVAQELVGPGVVKIDAGGSAVNANFKPAINKMTKSRPKHASAASSPNAGAAGTPATHWANFYNQTYVDGSWGAGTFVQDRIQIDTTPLGEVYNPYARVQGLSSPIDGTSSGKSSPSSPSDPLSGHGATVTFLDVIEDSLGLVKGYDGQISGLLGLTRASPTGRKTFLQELVEQGSLALPVVSMRLELEGGSFLLGGIDSSQYTGELIYNPVTDPVTWQISLQGLGTRYRSAASVSGGAGISGGVDTVLGAGARPPKPDEAAGGRMMPNMSMFQDAALILDSGTSSILIPTAASEVIHGELSGTWDPIHRVWFLPCEGPDLIWWISSGHGIIQPYESLVYLLEDGRCQSLIFENQDATYWILGDTWLRGLYLVYDMEGSGRIGIADANSSAGNSGSGNRPSEDVRILTVQDSSASTRLRQDAGSRASVILGWMLVFGTVFLLA